MELGGLGWILAVNLVIWTGLFLYLLPSQAFGHYAWAIKPPVNAAFIGAGFLAGTLATCMSGAVVGELM